MSVLSIYIEIIGLGKTNKVMMEENFLKLCEELDKEKSENSTMDSSLRRSQKIRKFVENMAQYDPWMEVPLV